MASNDQTNIQYCKPTGDYIIFEKIHPVAGFPSLGNYGPHSIKVWRTVVESCEFHATYLDGKLVDRPNALQTFQMAFGFGSLVTKPLGKKTLYMVYGGGNTMVSLPKIKIPGSGENIDSLQKLYDFFAKERNWNAHFNPISFGKDPLPIHQLYGNPNAVFISSNGGTDLPSAMAKYSKTTGKFEIITTEEAMKEEIRKLQFQFPMLQRQ